MLLHSYKLFASTTGGMAGVSPLVGLPSAENGGGTPAGEEVFVDCLP